MKPISVIIPVFNTEHTLACCVESVLAQTYSQIEVILVDDGSPDKCPSICDKLAAAHEAVKVIHKENGGLSSARLAGYEASKGDYILFVDSDDYIAPDMIEKLIGAIESDGSDLAMCSYYTVSGSREVANELPFASRLICGRENVTTQYILPLIGAVSGEATVPGFLCIRLLKRSLIQRSFFGSERKYFLEDHYFDLLYADSVESISVVNEPLYYYCVNPASLTNSYRSGKWGMYQSLCAFYGNYAHERGLDIENRIHGLMVGAVFSCIDNAVLSGNYRQYKRELRDLKNQPEAQRVLRSGVRGQNSTTRLSFALLRLGWYRLLYAIRKSRTGI